MPRQPTDQQRRLEIIKAALTSALSGTVSRSGVQITDEAIVEAIRTSQNGIMQIKKGDSSIELQINPGADPFIRDNGPTWVEHIVHVDDTLKWAVNPEQFEAPR